LKTADGHSGSCATVTTGARGDDRYRSVAVRQPRVRDREADAADPDRIRFSPSILPPYMRRSKSIETLLPILYLKGYRLATSPRRWRRCSARTQRVVGIPPSAA